MTRSARPSRSCTQTTWTSPPSPIGKTDPVGAVTRSELLSALGDGSLVSGAIDGLRMAAFRRLSPDDEIAGIPGSAVPALVLDEDGALAGVVSQEAYAEALQACIKEFREQVSSIMNSAESGIVAIDEDGVIVMANRLAEDLLGIRAIESIGRHILDVIPNTRLMEIMKSGKPLTARNSRDKARPSWSTTRPSSATAGWWEP